MIKNFSISAAASLSDIQASYYDYKLTVSQNYIRILIFIAGLINLLFLIPDIILIDSTAKRVTIIILRVFFSLTLLAVHLQIKNIKSFKQFSVITTIVEILALAIFLFVFSQYNQPSFLIQTIGMIMLNIIFFFVPNQFKNMLCLALSGSAAFFICATYFIDTLNRSELLAAVTYVIVTVLFCAVAAKNTEKHQFKEFQAKRELQQISSTDYLTNTANRFKMEAEAERWIEFCKRQGLPLSLVFIDVDDLKIVNDRYGHTAGDFVLAHLAELIKSQLRSSDILARWGGDEFIMLLSNVNLANAIKLTERIKNYIRMGSFIKGITVTCSFGVVEMNKNSNFSSLLLEADRLMYEGKKSGKDCIKWAE